MRHAAQRGLLVVGLALVNLLLGAATSFAEPLDVVGTADPGTPGLNTMVVGLDGFGYLGSWGTAAECPGVGVRVFDVRDPTAPTQLGTVAAYPGTSAEHLAAVRYATPAFVGNLLFAGIQRCSGASGAPSGLAIWDITDPTSPSEIGFFSVGRGVRGVHEFSLSQRGDRWYAYLAVPNAEVTTGTGDLRIVDVTDPRQPQQVVDWGARKDAGLSVGTGGQCAPACRGSVPQAFLHSVSLSADQRTAYLSYWDQGVVLLDVSEPSSPRWVGRFVEPSAAEGNTHSVATAHDGRLALVADETFGPPWGRLRLVDIQDPTNPLQVGTFDTAHSAAGTRGEQYAYTIHNPLTDDRNQNRAYLAWYADGVRLLDLSDASQPVELTSWVPPRGGMIWNVSFMGEWLLAGDIDNGLYVLRR
jgi:hypothetical protein